MHQDLSNDRKGIMGVFSFKFRGKWIDRWEDGVWKAATGEKGTSLHGWTNVMETGPIVPCNNIEQTTTLCSDNENTNKSANSIPLELFFFRFKTS